MHRRILAGLMIVAFVAACSNDSSSPTAGQNGPNGASAPITGTDTGSGSPTTPPTTPEPTSNGPVATVELSPKTLTLSVGYYGHINAIPRDANGVRVAGKMATWTSDNANIVVPSDTGVMYGKAVGTTTVHATIDGHTESASITVTAAVTPPSTPPAQPGVSQFDLTATVVGQLVGSDTSRTEPVAAAVVHLMRIGGITGDSLATAIDAGSATTDSRGVVSFKNLDGGSYTIDITPAAGSPYAAVHTGIGAPHVTDAQATFSLRRK